MLNSKIQNAWAKYRSICTDTRKLRPGDLFFALSGERFNGNAFVQTALDAGAAMVIADDPHANPHKDPRVELVASTLKELQNLARFERESRKIPFMGITGSNGKTTTKELIASLLSSEKKTQATDGNLNNHIGVPLTLLGLRNDIEIAVIEMGANKPGDIIELCEIARPTHCLITNIGHAHLELFGGLDGVERTKGEMFDFARANDGIVFVNEKDPRVRRRAEGIKHRITCGNENSDFSIAGYVQHHSGTKITIRSNRWAASHTFSSNLIGDHNAENILHAVAVGTEMGISPEGIRIGIASYFPTMNRSQFLIGPGFTILLDAYNANPSSMEAVIRNIFSMDYGKVSLVLGDMFELGDQSEPLHRELGKLISGLAVHKVVGIGKEMKHALSECPRTPQAWFANANYAGPSLEKELQGSDLVLIKGSRGMALEKVLPFLGVEVNTAH